MHHTLSRMLGNVPDYKICCDCKRIQWYENKECIDCGGLEFEKAHDFDILGLIESYAESGHFCDECEIDV